MKDLEIHTVSQRYPFRLHPRKRKGDYKSGPIYHMPVPIADRYRILSSNSFASIFFFYFKYIYPRIHTPIKIISFTTPRFSALPFQFHSPQKSKNQIMGLQNHLTDISSDSVPVFLLAVIAKGVSYLRSLIYTFLHTLGIISRHQSDHDVMDDSLFFDAVGSSLAGLILLADQLNLNNVISYKYNATSSSDLVENNHNFTECVVCLNTLTNGEQVRKLDCHHVFHKECFDGWLDHLNFNCPLCRSPLVSDERVAVTRRRLADDVMDWFSFRW